MHQIGLNTVSADANLVADNESSSITTSPKNVCRPMDGGSFICEGSELLIVVVPNVEVIRSINDSPVRVTLACARSMDCVVDLTISRHWKNGLIGKITKGY